MRQVARAEDNVVENVFAWICPVAVEVKVDPTVEHTGSRHGYGQVGIDVLVEHRCLVSGEDVGLETERDTIIVFVAVAQRLRFAFDLWSHTASEYQGRIANDVPCTIVGLERWVSRLGGGEWIGSIAVIEFDSGHNDRELGLVVDPIARQEVACIVLDTSQEEAAKFRTDANGILDKECASASDLSHQRSSAGCR